MTEKELYAYYEQLEISLDFKKVVSIFSKYIDVPIVNNVCSLCGNTTTNNECPHCESVGYARTTRFKNWSEQKIVKEEILINGTTYPIIYTVDLKYDSDNYRIVASVKKLYIGNSSYNTGRAYRGYYFKNTLIIKEDMPEDRVWYHVYYQSIDDNAIYYENVEISPEDIKFITMNSFVKSLPKTILKNNLKLIELSQKLNSEYIVEYILSKEIYTIRYNDFCKLHKKVIYAILKHYNVDNRVSMHELTDLIVVIQKEREVTIEDVIMPPHLIYGKWRTIMTERDIEEKWQEYIELVEELDVYQVWKKSEVTNWFYLDSLRDSVKKLKDEKAIRARIRQREEIEKMYSETKNFEIGKFVVVPPKSLRDLKTEGDNLNNCIGSYMGRVNKGNHIIFVRDKTSPDKSLYAFRYQKRTSERAFTTPYELVEARGYRNSSVPNNVRSLINDNIEKIMQEIGLE